MLASFGGRVRCMCLCIIVFFFFNDTATTEIYTLSLHDALPICVVKLENRAQYLIVEIAGILLETVGKPALSCQLTAPSA